MKKIKTKIILSKKTSMDTDLFEHKYYKQIESLTESILDTKKKLNDDNYEEEYDNAYEEALYVLASEKGITLE